MDSNAVNWDYSSYFQSLWRPKLGFSFISTGIAKIAS